MNNFSYIHIEFQVVSYFGGVRYWLQRILPMGKLDVQEPTRQGGPPQDD
jgi:hypothetical protein